MKPGKSLPGIAWEVKEKPLVSQVIMKRCPHHADDAFYLELLL